ncbi:MAG: MbnP family protein [Flavobacteriales bacterium]
MLLRWTKISALVALLGLVSCKSTVPEFELVEIEPKIVLSFELVNEGETIDIGDAFKDQEGYNLALRTFKFYVSNIELISAGGAIENLSSVELVDFNDNEDGGNNMFTQSYNYVIPKGDYTNLRFSVGLPSNLNATDPTTVENDNPLSTLSGMYWDWGSMYVFIMMEAGIDTTGDAAPDANIAFHTGLDTLFRQEQNYPMTFEIPAFAKDSLHIQIDWNKLFNVEGETYIDLSTKPYFHANTGLEALDMTRKFTDNFIHAIRVTP